MLNTNNINNINNTNQSSKKSSNEDDQHKITEVIDNLTAMILRPDKSKIPTTNNSSAILRNHIPAFQDLMLEYLPWLFKPDECITLYDEGTNIQLKWNGIEFGTKNNNPPVICQEKQESFTNDCRINYTIIQDGKEMITYSITLTIPMLCNTGETDPWGIKSINPRQYNHGGFVLSGKGMIKYPVSIEDDKHALGQVNKKISNNTTDQFSFYVDKDMIRSYNKGQIPQFFKITLDIINCDMMISCNNNNVELRLPPINILIFACYLCNITLEELKNCLKTLDYSDNGDVHNIIDIIIYRAEELISNTSISEYVKNCLSEEKTSSEIVKKTSYEIVITNLMFQYNMFGLTPNLRKGLMLIVQMRRMLMALYNPIYYPDRDSMIRKRYLCSAKYYAKIFSDKVYEISLLSLAYKMKDSTPDLTKIQKDIDRTLTGIVSTINSDISTGTFDKRTGVWVHDGYTSSINSISRLTSTVKKLQKDITKDLQFRYFQNSQFMFQCPADVPEHGENVGLVNSTTVITSISTIFPNQKEATVRTIIDVVIKFRKANKVTGNVNAFIVIIDDIVINRIDTNLAYKLYTHLRQLKRHKQLGRHDIGIVIDNYLNEIRINLDNGRLVQPILVVIDGVLELSKVNINDIIKFIETKNNNITEFMDRFPDVLEYVDCDMVQVPSKKTNYIAMSIEDFYTLGEDERKNIDFCGLAEWGYFGWNINHRILCNFSEAIRNVFYCSLAKSAIHNKILSKSTFDNYHNLTYTFTPIFDNPVIRASHMAKLGYCQLLWVLIMPYMNGLNQEDGVIVNRDSVHAGMLSSIQVTKNVIIVNKAARTDYTDKVILHSNQSKINPITGLPFINSIIRKGDALVRDFELINSSKNGITHKDNSETYFDFSSARVEKVYIDQAKPSNVNLILVSHNDMINGDKLSSLGAQKSTVVSIVDKTELPHTPDGLYPNLIMSPTGICTRKTFGMITSLSTFLNATLRKSDFDETIKSSIRVRMGPIENKFDWINDIEKAKVRFDKAKKYYDSWPNQKSEDLANSLHDMIHPYTNEIIKGSFGQFDYFKSRHLVNYKKNICNNGHISEDTKQTTANRKSGGAAKFDEMSRNVTICYGAAYTLKELLSEPENRREAIHICKTCSNAARYVDNGEDNYYVCDICINKYDQCSTMRIEITYAARKFLELPKSRGVTILCNESEYNGPMMDFKSRA